MSHTFFLTGLALAGLFTPPSSAASYAYDLSGEQFLQMMTHPEPLSAAHYADRDKAYSYLDGAEDATVGRTWCPPQPRKTFELAYDAADHLTTLTPAARKGNAPTLLITYLEARYPCTKGPRKRASRHMPSFADTILPMTDFRDRNC